MRSVVLTAFLLGLAVNWLAAPPVVWSAPPPPLAPIEGILLLHNGEVLAGRITHAGDYYYLSRPHGDLRLKAAEVELVAADLNEVYQNKRGQMEQGNPQAHLDLAEWCVLQKLLDQAADELSEAAQIAPNHPRLSLIQRRLELARRGEPPAAHGKKTEPGPTNDDLDRLVRGMPRRLVEEFTSTVQPMLVNNCTSAGCHNAHSSGKLRLLRLPRTGIPSRRLTQRNLHSVWQVIDPADPLASPLLTQPIAPHGAAKDAIFSSREVEQYRQLVSWVQELAPKGKRARPPNVAKRADPLLQTAPQRGTASRRAPRPRPISPPSDGEPAAVDLDLTDPDAAPIDPDAVPPNNATPPQRETDYEPIDPFDPEIFNRRFFGGP